MSELQAMGITRDLVDRFVDADMALITAVWGAIWDYQKEPEPDWDETLQVWINRVCDNLHNTHARIKDARNAFLEGDPSLIQHCAYVQLGLSRNLNEFDIGWASPENTETIDKALDRLIGTALKIAGLSNGTSSANKPE